MKSGILWLLLSCVVVLSLVFVGCTAKPAPTTASAPLPSAPATAPAKQLPQIEIKHMAANPAGTPQFESMDAWPARMIEQATNGRVKVTIYPGASLAPAPDMYRALQEGVGDFCWLFAGYNPGAFPVADLFSLPGLFSPNMATSNVVLNALYDKYPAFTEQFSPKVKHVATQVMLRSEFHFTKPVSNLAGVKGKIMGCANELAAKISKQLGATPSVIPLTEMYTSGERGVVDGVIVPWGAYGNWRLYEVYKHHLLAHICPTPSFWLMSRSAWDKFTPDEQQKIQLLRPWLQLATNQGAPMPTEKIMQTEILPEKGHMVVELSDQERGQLETAGKPMWDEWVAQMEAKGIPGRDILADALRLLKLYGDRTG